MATVTPGHVVEREPTTHSSPAGMAMVEVTVYSPGLAVSTAAAPSAFREIT